MEMWARELGIVQIPASWPAAWAAYQTWLREPGRAAPEWQLPPRAQAIFDLPAEALPELEELYAALHTPGPLSTCAGFWHFLIYYMPEGTDRFTNVWKLPDLLGGRSQRQLMLACMAVGAELAWENFRRAGLSEEVAYASLGYIGRYARDIKAKRGVWGIESMGWLSQYARAGVFRLGRLTFNASTFALPYRIFRHWRTGAVQALCEAGERVRTDGLIDGTNGVRDPAAWTATFTVDAQGATGHPVSGAGVVERQTVQLSASDWEQVVAPGDPTIAVHIAGGSRMELAECRASYRQAVEFFPRRYAPQRFVAFTCWSWLLDPALARLLPATSNIVQFQRDFHVLPVCADEAQTYDLVFGSSQADPTKLTPKTQLQRLIAEHVAAGHRMRAAAGFFLWDEALELVAGAISNNAG